MSKSVSLSVDGVQAGLRVVFEFQQDRYAHRIERCDMAGKGAALLESVEGDAEEVWPASPAIQEVQLESRTGGSRVALCVGRAGKSHWSLAVQLDADAQQLVFQAACRVGEIPELLTSTYRLANDASDANFVLLAEAPATLLQATEEQRIFLPRKVVRNAPQTVTWQYTIAMQASRST